MINPLLDLSTGLLEKKIERGKLDKFRNKSYPDPFYIGFERAYTLLQKFRSGSRLVVFCLKGVLTNFAKFHKEKPALKTRFQWSCKSTEFNVIKNEIPAQLFSCELCKISLNTFFKELFRRLLLLKRWSCLPSHHDLRHFCHTYFLSLISGLGTRMSLIFQGLFQKPVFNPVRHLQ